MLHQLYLKHFGFGSTFSMTGRNLLDSQLNLTCIFFQYGSLLCKTLSSNLTGLISSYGYIAVFILMTAESALIPIPSEVTMTFAGFLAESAY